MRPFFLTVDMEIEGKKTIIPLPAEFPFMVTDAEMQPGFDMGRVYHWHDCLEISYIKTGSGKYYTRNNIYDVSAGDVVIFNNIEPHYLEVGGERMRQPVFVFDPMLVFGEEDNCGGISCLGPFFRRGSDFRNLITPDSPFSEEVRHNLTLIETEFKEKPEGYRLMIKARLLTILVCLLRHYRDNDRRQPANLRLMLERMDKSVNYINSNYTDDITLAEAASKAFMSPAYFSRVFKQAMGVTFSRYLTRVRINASRLMIRENRMKVIDISRECGFQSLSAFNAAFKKETGISPASYRTNQ